MSATPTPIAVVEAEAALTLLALAARQLRRAAEELDALAPPPITFLASTLERVCATGEVSALTVELARKSAYRARRCELATAFSRLNPGFGLVHDGCWADVAGMDNWDRRRQQRTQRRELELSMGERFARLLAPIQGGKAA